MNRRSFVKNAGILAAYTAGGFPQMASAMSTNSKSIQVIKTASDFEREKLVRPFGFKGGYLTELWQVASKLNSANKEAIGLATQSILYGDAALFASRAESE